MRRLLIIDHLALFHRCRRALERTGRTFSTSDGQSTTGIFAYLQALLAITREQEPTHVVIAYDAGGNTRKAEDADYKANRPKQSDDFYRESDILKYEAAYALGVEAVGLKGYEADDIIATYAHVAQFGIEQFDDIIIATVDQDLLQCVTSRVKVLLYSSAKKMQLMDVDAVHEKWGCWPEDIAMVKALSGDASDNIKGVKGVGKKTAIKICEEAAWFPEKIYEHPKLKDHVEKIKENLQLVGLRNCLGDIGPIRWSDHVLGLGQRSDWEQFLSKYELNSLAKRVAKTAEMMKLRG